MSAEPEQPNRKYMHPESGEYKAKKAAEEKHYAALERAEWLQLWRIYERCVDIAHKVWDTKLEDAQVEQREIAEAMRDRLAWNEAGGKDRREIPVPLFTPRDRLQFIKEVAVNLTISAGQRGLSIRFPKEWMPRDAEMKPEAGTEAASGASEETLDTEARQVAAQGAVNQSSRPEPNADGVPLTR